MIIYKAVMTVVAARLSPRGMIDRYFPLNLLATVISCLRVQPRSEITWWAAAGGWWLTCIRKQPPILREETWEQIDPWALGLHGLPLTHDITLSLYSSNPITRLNSSPQPQTQRDNLLYCIKTNTQQFSKPAPLLKHQFHLGPPLQQTTSSLCS